MTIVGVKAAREAMLQAVFELERAMQSLQDPEGSIPISPGPEADALCAAMNKLRVAVIPFKAGGDMLAEIQAVLHSKPYSVRRSAATTPIKKTPRGKK